MALFHSFLVFHCIYVLHLLYPFVCWWTFKLFLCLQFSSVAQSCLTLCDPTNRSMPGLPVHHQLLEFTQTHVHRVGDAIQPSYPLSSPSPPDHNPSQYQSSPMSQLFTWGGQSTGVSALASFCTELMLLNCGVGEDSWESLGLQGDPTSPFWRRSALGFLWKEWC